MAVEERGPDMPTLNATKESRSKWQPPPMQPLDETVWQAWLTKGRRQEARSARTRLETVKMASIVGLLGAAGVWPYVAPYEVLLRFAVALAAVFVMFNAFQGGHYTFAALLGAVALLYNPVAPVFRLSDDWQRFLLVASAIPFIASLGWRNVRTRRHE
jgi:hypothetical protein